MRCSMCGHESPGGSSFCLNCGSSLAQALVQTPSPGPGLPGISVCAVCRGENPGGMKFCRSCGSALPLTGPGSPAFAAGPQGPAAGKLGGPIPGMPSGPLGGFPAGPFGGAPPALGSAAMLPPGGARPAQASTIACPRCGTQTPLGFAFCQQCGLHIQALSPEPSATPRGPGPAVPPLGAKLDGPIDPHAGTIAQDDRSGPALASAVRAAAASLARPQAGASWGTAVLVNRDGSDGQRYALAGEYLVVGRAGADIAFEDDRFLARQHARIERGGDGVVKVQAIDTLNGVFRKTDAPVDLIDGTTILVGREVLRYERVEPEEGKAHPLVRHGVALFGSPPREPWGRLVQLVPSGGYRDVRHLSGDEIVLGREEGDIVFRDDAFMSRRHAAVTWDGKRAQITDLGSSNGTFVRVIGPTALSHGDHVRMGDQLLRFELGR